MSDGIEIVGIIGLTADTRIAARKYSPDAYRKTFYGGENDADIPSNPPVLRRYAGRYHSEDDTIPGSPEGKKHFFDDLSTWGVDVSKEQRKDIADYWKQKTTWDTLNTRYSNEDAVIQCVKGVKHPMEHTVQSCDPTDASYWGRAWLHAGMHADLGVVYGRVNLSSPEEEATEEKPVIDDDIRRNFGTIVKPSRDYSTASQGCLWIGGVLEQDDPPKPECSTTKPYCLPVMYDYPLNDSLTLGAIQYNRTVYSASPLTSSNMVRADKSGLTATGREQAILSASGIYERHRSSVLGDTSISVGALDRKKFDMMELMEGVALYTNNECYRNSLSDLTHLVKDLQPGEIIVERLETKIGGRWLGAREVNNVKKSD